MVTQRVISGSAASKIITKASSGSWLDIGTKINGLTPAFVKLTDEESWNFYKGNDHIFSCVNKIMNDCVKAQPHVGPKDKNVKVSKRMEDRIKLVEDFLDNPNGNKESFFDIRQKTIKDMLVYGRACIEKVNDNSGRLSEIFAQNPALVRVCSDTHGNLEPNRSYMLNVRGNETYWSIDEMIFMVLSPVSGSHYGVKILDAIANTVAADILRGVFNATFFTNGAEASGVLSCDGMSKTELEKFKKAWVENFKGAKKSHRVAVVNVPINWVRMAVTNRDMQFGEYGSELRSKILEAYSIPPFVMGIIDTGGKVSSSEQIDLYKDSALRPILAKESYHYTTEICDIGFGFKDISITFPTLDYADTKTQAEIDRNDVETGVVTINEVRKRRGLVEVAWGNTPISILPGGGQVDPNTGTILSPSNNKPGSKPKPKPKSNKKSFVLEKYIDTIKTRLTVLDEEFAKFTYPENLVLKQLFKTGTIFIEGIKYTVTYNSIPVELKNTDLNKILDEVLDSKFFLEENDVRKYYLDAIGSKIRYSIYDCIYKKNLNNLNTEIDKILYDEKSSEIFARIF